MVLTSVQQQYQQYQQQQQYQHYQQYQQQQQQQWEDSAFWWGVEAANSARRCELTAEEARKREVQQQQQYLQQAVRDELAEIHDEFYGPFRPRTESHTCHLWERFQSAK